MPDIPIEQSPEAQQSATIGKARTRGVWQIEGIITMQNGLIEPADRSELGENLHIRRQGQETGGN